MLALNVIVWFLVIENLLKHLEECIGVKTKKLLHKPFIGTKPDYIHGIKPPALLAEATLGELFAFKEQFNHPKYFIAYVGSAVFYFKLQAACFLKHLLFVFILQLHAIGTGKFKNRSSIVLQVNSQ